MRSLAARAASCRLRQRAATCLGDQADTWVRRYEFNRIASIFTEDTAEVVAGELLVSEIGREILRND